MGHIGIDPGRKVTSPGGIAYIQDNGDYEAHFMPQGAASLFHLLEEIFQEGGTSATIEQQWARPTDAPKHAAKLAQNYGEIIGILTGLGIRFRFVSPQRWQRDIFGDRYGTGKTKDVSLDIARSLYPLVRMTNKARDNGKADSLLVCQWGIAHPMDNK